MSRAIRDANACCCKCQLREHFFVANRFGWVKFIQQYGCIITYNSSYLTRVLWKISPNPLGIFLAFLWSPFLENLLYKSTLPPLLASLLLYWEFGPQIIILYFNIFFDFILWQITCVCVCARVCTCVWGDKLRHTLLSIVKKIGMWRTKNSQCEI